jgi:hypothetical protein
LNQSDVQFGLKIVHRAEWFDEPAYFKVLQMPLAPVTTEIVTAFLRKQLQEKKHDFLRHLMPRSLRLLMAKKLSDQRTKLIAFFLLGYQTDASYFLQSIDWLKEDFSPEASFLVQAGMLLFSGHPEKYSLLQHEPVMS